MARTKASARARAEPALPKGIEKARAAGAKAKTNQAKAKAGKAATLVYTVISMHDSELQTRSAHKIVATAKKAAYDVFVNQSPWGHNEWLDSCEVFELTRDGVVQLECEPADSGSWMVQVLKAALD